MRPNRAQGEENYTPKGEELIQFLFTKVKPWIATVMKQKCARMHQILFQFPFFRGNTPGPPLLGLCPRPPGRGGRRWEGKGRGGKGKGGGWEGEGEVCVIAVREIDAPG